MDAAQILMVPLAGAVPPVTPSGTAPAPVSQVSSEDAFSQLLGELLNGVVAPPASDLEQVSEGSDPALPQTSESPAELLRDPVMQQIAVAGIPVPVQQRNGDVELPPEQASTVLPAAGEASFAVRQEPVPVAAGTMVPVPKGAAAVSPDRPLSVTAAVEIPAVTQPGPVLAKATDTNPSQSPSEPLGEAMWPRAAGAEVRPAGMHDVRMGGQRPHVSAEVPVVAVKDAVVGQIRPQPEMQQASVAAVPVVAVENEAVGQVLTEARQPAVDVDAAVVVRGEVAQVQPKPELLQVQQNDVAPTSPVSDLVVAQVQPQREVQQASGNAVPVVAVPVAAVPVAAVPVAAVPVAAVKDEVVKPAQPKPESQQVRPIGALPVVEVKDEVVGQVEPEPEMAVGEAEPEKVAVAQARPRQATEWWSYEHKSAAQASAPSTHDAAVGTLRSNAAEVEKMTVAPQAGVETVQPVVPEAVPEAVFSEKAVSGEMMPHHEPSVPPTKARSEVVTATDKTTDSARPTLPEQVPRQVAERLGVHEFKQGKERLSLTLNPEHLGRIQMNFQMEQQNLRVEIVAENRTVRDALVQQADLVKESLARQNITVEKFDISTSGERAFQQHQQSQQQRGLYASLYERQGGGRSVAAGLSDGMEMYPAAEGLQYFEQQYESTFTYRA